MDGRLKLLVGTGQVDVQTASSGHFSSNPMDAFDQFAELREWATTVQQPTEDFNGEAIGPPVPAPRQIFAIGLNYALHAAESGFQKPEHPVVFTKFQSSLSGPRTRVELPPGSVDWEIEVVVVIGATARRVTVADAWRFVAGLTAGQDLSEREIQRSGPAPQFNLAKSFPGFSPIGPVLVTSDEFINRNEIRLGCSVNGVLMQDDSTRDMIFPIPELVSYLSHIVTLYPGDIIYTGTPSGVGAGRTPPMFLRDADVLTSWIDGIGELEQTFEAPRVAKF